MSKNNKAGWHVSGAQSQLLVWASTNAVQAIGTGAYVDSLFQYEERDTLGEYDPVTGIYTAQNAADYLVIWRVSTTYVAWTVNQYWESLLSRNNLTADGDCWQAMEQGFAEVTGISQVIASGGVKIVPLTVGQTLRVKILHNRGADVNTYGARQHGFFQIARLT
ncbi:hypothetical protein EH223_08470 [candidate division KSB1 bacterium]|nr:MAG: hypothetical protein EH223_08470 [candidate division KSB1 bacterium]